MQTCSFTDIETDFDRLVAEIAARQGVDPICSASNWIVPVATTFSASSRQRVFTSDAGHVALLEHDTPSGLILSSFDAVWGFSTPLIGEDPTALVIQFASLLKSLDFYVCTISGLDPAGPLFDEVQSLSPAGFTDTADRCIVDLRDGFEAWISRRSSRFRRSLRAAAHRGESRGLSIEHVAPTSQDELAALFDRLLTIEETSWKTDASSGLVDTSLGQFTHHMCSRFAARGQLRMQFAQRDGSDIGYVVGARVGDRYRGFQHSFDQSHTDLSIGKVLQYHTISALADEGVQTYDMGMHMGYKESYSDRIESTVTAVIAGEYSGRDPGPPQ